MNPLLLKTYRHPLQMGDKYEQKLLINTINSHSYNTALRDKEFYNALMKSDILIPDGVGVVYALRLLYGIKVRKIAAWDLMIYELEQLEKTGGKCFFLGSSQKVLDLLTQRAAKDYPHVKIATYSPPFKPTFSDEDNNAMIAAVNQFAPEVLFVGMTAPKQEKWVAANFEKLNVKHVGCIGATFDFYAGTVNRAPKWMLILGMEWLYRLYREPKRLWRRYVIGNPKFIWLVVKGKFKLN